MKSCPHCQVQNPDEANFCHQCGGTFAATAPKPPPPPDDDTHFWKSFVGPKSDHYLEVFKKFSSPSGPRFAFTWNWAAFLFEPFLWFLYRKMYVYALVYAVGPVVAFYFTQDLSADLVWRVMAGASANYIYFWHVKEHLAQLKPRLGFDNSRWEQSLRDAGGVQPYVIWVGVALLLVKVGLLVSLGLDGPSDRGLFPRPAGKSHGGKTA
jgi:hypothetical protein